MLHAESEYTVAVAWAPQAVNFTNVVETKAVHVLRVKSIGLGETVVMQFLSL